ncbi:MAG: hypothetical protein V4850_18980 [Myxococcota bacterium]
MPAYLPLIVSFVVGLFALQITGSPRIAQAAGLFALSATVVFTGSIRLSGLVFDGNAARIAGIGIGVLGILRLYIDHEFEQRLDGAAHADTAAP